MAPQPAITKPDPDPTSLTTDNLLREVGHVREHAEGLVRTLETELRAIRNMGEERFASIDNRFKERDIRNTERTTAASAALAAALQSARDLGQQTNEANDRAVQKSEAAFTRQIELLGANIAGIGKGLDGKVEDVKASLNRLEGRVLQIESLKIGAAENRKGIDGNVTLAISIAAVVVAIYAAWHPSATVATPQPIVFQQPAQQQGDGAAKTP